MSSLQTTHREHGKTGSCATVRVAVRLYTLGPREISGDIKPHWHVTVLSERAFDALVDASRCLESLGACQTAQIDAHGDPWRTPPGGAALEGEASRDASKWSRVGEVGVVRGQQRLFLPPKHQYR